MATSPCRFATSLSFTRRGTFWRKPKQGEVRIGGQETAGSTRRETSPCLLRRHPSPSQGGGDGNLTLSLCDVPLLQQGEGRFGESQNRVRSGQVGKKQQAQQGEKPHPVCFADISLLHKGEGIATSPCCPSPSTRRRTFWRKPKQGEVEQGSQNSSVNSNSQDHDKACV